MNTPARETMKNAVAIGTAFVLTFSSSASLVAQSRTKWQATSHAQAVEHVDKLMPSVGSPEFQRTWEAMSDGRNRISRFAPAATTSMNIGSLLEHATEMRAVALRLAKGSDQTAAKRASRLLTWLDIATSASREERHQRIRTLPVTVVESSTSDGRLQKDFVVRGRVVRRVLSAATQSDHFAGPSALSCYNEQPEPCLTQEEQDDLIIFIAAAEDEVAAMQSELDAEWAEYEAYCNTWGCDEGNAPDHPMSGPSEFTPILSAGCASQAAIATVGGAVAAFEIIDGALGVGGAVAHTALIATAEATAIAGGITAGVLLFAYGLYNFIECKRAKVRAPDQLGARIFLAPSLGTTKLSSLNVY